MTAARSPGYVRVRNLRGCIVRLKFGRLARVEDDYPLGCMVPLADASVCVPPNQPGVAVRPCGRPHTKASPGEQCDPLLVWAFTIELAASLHARNPATA